MSVNEKRFRLLADYLRGSLGDEEREVLERQIAGDPHLQKLVRMMSELRQESASIEWDKLREPVHGMFSRLLKDFKHAARDKDARRGIRTYDSKYLPLPEGVRPATVNTRRIRYQIGEVDLDLSFYPLSPGSYELIGQLSGQECGEILKVELIHGREKQLTSANQFQLFRFERVAVGVQTLKIKRKGRIIALVDIEL
jgi:hypothetical protein